MAHHIEASIPPALYNALRDETKRRGLRLHQAVAALLAERLTLEASDVVALEKPSTSAAPRRQRKKTRKRSAGIPTPSPRASSEPDPHSEGM